MWKEDNQAIDEARKIRYELVPYTRGLVLDIGCGPSKAFDHFIGIDNRKDSSLFNIAMNPDLVVPDACDLSMLASCKYDAVFSSHLLEHIENHEKALREWFRLVKHGGYLCLYLPHKKFYPNIGTKWANPDHKHDFMPEDIVSAMREIGGWDLIRNEDRNEDDEYSFFQVYKKFSDAKVHRYTYREPKPAKTCAIIRYGAWGDCIQMSSVLPALKEEGYHITVYTTVRAVEAIRHEPMIDAFVIQDTDQVPNHELGPFWHHLSKKYDKFINLSESIEGTLLAMPERIQAKWPHAMRHFMMDHNYLELTHKIAEVPYVKPKMRFVPSEEETRWAKAEYKKFSAAPLIMWVIRGSSVHKVWNGGVNEKEQITGVDEIFARILYQWPNAKIITVGDEWCKQKIEPVWANEKRIMCRSSIWSIRETMTMAQQCDIVIGPETGVLSAVSMEKMRKIVFLSHSSVHNLTEGWVNTVSLVPKDTPCYPCHKLVYHWNDCVQDGDSGIAKCQASIKPAEVWDAIREELDKAEAA